MQYSVGVIGFSDHFNDRYIHLSDTQEVKLVLSQNKPKTPYLESINANITNIKVSEDTLEFRATNEFTPVVARVANVKKCVTPKLFSQKQLENVIELRSKGAIKALSVRCEH